jgi:hypothetical protein
MISNWATAGPIYVLFLPLERICVMNIRLQNMTIHKKADTFSANSSLATLPFPAYGSKNSLQKMLKDELNS